MKPRPSSAFTLIEIVTAMTVILILTGLVIAISGFVQNKSYRTRAINEWLMLETAAHSYKADSGRYPQDETTDALQPKNHFLAGESVYQKANLFLYQELAGDRLGQGGSTEPDGVLDPGAKAYWEPRNPNMLKVERDANRRIIRVRCIQDPWGDPYGYSTAALAVEQAYQNQLKLGNSSAARPTAQALPGFNSASPDLWSVSNHRPFAQPTSVAEKARAWAKWNKNW